jgi:putative Mn2+ efflux pump MntP
MTLTGFGMGVAKVQKALGRYYNLVPSLILILIVLVEMRKSTAEAEVVYMM